MFEKYNLAKTTNMDKNNKETKSKNFRHIFPQFSCRNELDYSVFDIFQTIMIIVEDFNCFVQIVIIFCFFAPYNIF